MKKHLFAVLPDPLTADQVINQLHTELNIASDEISYVYRDEAGEKVSGDGTDVASHTTTEGGKEGAKTGGIIGAGLGLVAATGVLGPLGTVVTAGPFATALGLTGALGVTAGGAATGALAGGLIGMLTNMGVSEPHARTYEEAVGAGKVLISIHTDEADHAIATLEEHNAEAIQVIEENI